MASRDLPTAGDPGRDLDQQADQGSGPGLDPDRDRTATTDFRGDFDRIEVSAILRRAIAVAFEQDTIDGERLTARDLAVVADEVGVPPAALATALAESRAGAEPRGGSIDRLLGRLVGPSRVWAAGRANADDGTTAENIQRWLEVDHGLATYIRDDGVVVASRRGGVAGAIGAGVRRLQGTGGLNRVRSVRAATASVERDGAVCVVADVGNKRAEAIAGGTVVAGGSMAAIGVVAIVAGPLALLGLPVAAVVGVGTARLTHRRTVHQVGEQVEQTTHAVARDEAPVHPVERMLRSGLPRR